MTTREQQARQTYEHILQTAESLLENISYDELSVNEICEKANISKGGFYHHFSSKDQLIALLIGRQMERLVEKKLAPLLGTMDALSLLELYIQTSLDYLKNSPKDTLARCWLTLSEHEELTNSNFSQSYYALIHNIVLQGKHEGSIRSDIDTAFCESYLAASYTGIMLYAISFNMELSTEHFVNQSLKMIHQTIS